MYKNIVSSLKLIRRNFINKKKVHQLILKLKTGGVNKRIFLFQTPTHSNIGDHAIAEAQLDFLNVHFPNLEVIEINQSLMQYFIKHHKSHIRPVDVITLHGGGNFGNEYLHEENLRRLVVQSFPANNIIVFPQTMHYSEDEDGQHELEKTQTIFNNHNNLTVTAREKISFELMKKFFPNNNVILTPDIVLFTSQIKPSTRNYGLKVIRQDQESILSAEDKRAIDSLLRASGNKIIVSDMHVAGFKSIKTVKERREVLENKYNQFRQAEIAITDRLHGMVLAAITGTPCIVFSNYNQKVKGTYEWLKDLEYIRFVKNIDEAKKAYAELKNLKTFEVFNNQELSDLYNPLEEAINGK